jgi:hypothetical protein
MPALPMFTSLNFTPHTEAQVALNEAMFATGHGVGLWKLGEAAIGLRFVVKPSGTCLEHFPVFQTVWLDWELKTLGSQRL